MELYRTSLRITAACLIIIGVCTTGGEALEFADISIDKTAFNPTARQKINVSFRLDDPAKVTAVVRDADFFPVATLADERLCHAGVTVFQWNGRADDGTVVPDEAYTVRLEAEDDLGVTAIFDSAITSGGEPIKYFPADLDKDNSRVRFHTSVPARVQILAGITDGPLMTTILDWMPYPAGDHEIEWNGYDQSRNARVWDDKNFKLVARAYRLPDLCVVTQGNPTTYMDYWTAAASKRDMTAVQYRISTKAGMESRMYAKTARAKALSDERVRLGSPYLSGKFRNQSAKFSIETATSAGKTGTPARIEIRISVDPKFKHVLDEQRYEYVMYVDGVLQGEQETGFSPYTWVLDTSTISAGKRLVTVNIATIDGQTGAASSWIEVAE